MDDDARDALREIVASEGEVVLDDPRRFRALLLDRCGGSRVEVKLLIAALEEEVPAMMLASSDGTPTTILVDRLTRRLEEARSLAPEPARWSVESWALALGLADRAPRPSLGAAAGASGTELADRTAAAVPAADGGRRAAPGEPPLPPASPPAPTPRPPAKSSRTKKIVALVGVGALVVAVVAVVAINAGGGSDSKSTAPPIPTGGSTTAPVTTPEDALLGHIPPKIKDTGTCAKPDVRAAVRFNNVPVLGCVVAAAVGSDVTLRVFYYSLPDQTTIDVGLDAEVAKYGLGPGSCDPDVDPAFSANSGTFYTDAHVPVGRVLCGVDANGNPFMQWTDTRLKTYQSAFVTGPSADNPDKLALKKAVFGFWRDNGGLVT